MSNLLQVAYSFEGHLNFLSKFHAFFAKQCPCISLLEHRRSNIRGYTIAHMDTTEQSDMTEDLLLPRQIKTSLYADYPHR